MSYVIPRSIKSGPFLAAVITSSLLIFVLLAPLPNGARETQAFLNLLHAPSFAVAAVVLARATTTQAGYQSVWIWLLLVVAGLMTEIGQSFFGRSPSWTDALANAVGALVGMVWVHSSRAVSLLQQTYLGIICVMLIVGVSVPPFLDIVDSALQRREAPMLASLEHRLELTRWNAKHCDLSRVRRHATHGSWALRMDLHPARYPGATLRWPIRNWSQYSELVFDISLDDGRPLDVIVKIEDTEHNQEYEDRFHRTIHLSPGTHEFRIPLSNVIEAPRERQMNLRSISLIQFFSVKLPTKRTLFLDNIHLK